MCFKDCDEHVGRYIDGFSGVHGEYHVGQKSFKERMLLEFCLWKELFGLREEKSNLTYSMGENETEIDFMLIKNEHYQYVQNVRTILGEFQQALVVVDINKKKMINCSEKDMY